ncbi:metal ABC transporter permease [bacterium]|nr:metal ABC transporter permease [bacterium]
MMDILFSAFLLSVVLLGIHSFFGLEIIKRGIIFTDLAIGQMAALGAAGSILFLHGKWIYPVSLSFALLGGLCIARASHKIKNLEAFIGLLYALGLSGAFLLLSKTYHGMEEFQKLMASDILFTPIREIYKTAVLYAALGIFLCIFLKKCKGLLRDTVFFLTFAVTVTSSVKLAGVLIIFALLVGPAYTSLILFNKNHLLYAWLIGVVVNIVAIFVSYKLDLPTGYTIVFSHALAAVLISIATTGIKKEARNAET